MVSAGPYRKELYGEVDMIVYRCRAAVITVSLIYAAASVAAFLYAESIGELALYVAAAVVFLFSLWRIHGVHHPVCLLCREAMLLSYPRNILSSLKSSAEPLYMPVEYDRIVGISDDWRQLYIGTMDPGNLVSIPMQLIFVSTKDKKKIKEYIEMRQTHSASL